MVYTVGHSTRSLEELTALLEEHGVDTLVDVRRFPGSRRHPHFGGAALAAALASHGIRYVHEEALGGRRESRPDSPHGGLRNAGFRAYADHMDSADFDAAVARLMAAARDGAPAVMCAEAVPWRCHRWLLSDALLARGARVLHIMGDGPVRAHTLHPDGRLVGEGRVAYPPPQASLFEDG
ncbi:MAG TPA: DUF488 domain-containing protein [Longimicrobiales bacterium]|nr:DUF488 domain-containing protein [Longimicrobiales bacterium]